MERSRVAANDETRGAFGAARAQNELERGVNQGCEARDADPHEPTRAERARQADGNVDGDAHRRRTAQPEQAARQVALGKILFGAFHREERRELQPQDVVQMTQRRVPRDVGGDVRQPIATSGARLRACRSHMTAEHAGSQNHRSEQRGYDARIVGVAICAAERAGVGDRFDHEVAHRRRDERDGRDVRPAGNRR
jgi:hypothetical protein